MSLHSIFTSVSFLKNESSPPILVFFLAEASEASSECGFFDMTRMDKTKDMSSATESPHRKELWNKLKWKMYLESRYVFV